MPTILVCPFCGQSYSRKREEQIEHQKLEAQREVSPEVDHSEGPESDEEMGHQSNK